MINYNKHLHRMSSGKYLYDEFYDFIDGENNYLIQKYFKFECHFLYIVEKGEYIGVVENNGKEIKILSYKLLEKMKEHKFLFLSNLGETVEGIEKIPDTITTLFFSNCNKFNQPLLNLPPSIKTACFYLKKYDYAFDYFPIDMESLNIMILTKYTKSMLNLPLGLKKLKLSLIVDDDFKINFPSNLEEVRMDCDVDINTLPDSVKVIYLTEHNKKKITKLPKNLEAILKVSGVCNVDGLPELLEKINQMEGKRIIFSTFNLPNRYF